MWVNLPGWKDTHRETYKKMLRSHIGRISQRGARSEAERRKLAILERELSETERKERIAAAAESGWALEKEEKEE